MSDTISALLQSIPEIIKDTPYCEGTVQLSDDDLVLFYGKGPTARRIDLRDATKEDLDHLTNECDPATFGLNHADVLDETYRKAGKLDKAHFACHFDPSRLGLIDAVISTLLEGYDEEKKVEVELYKLNVYSEGSFFKSHKDTPRSERMFASLVVVLPTPHQGGNFILNHSDKRWSFDSGKILSENGARSASYIAFYSDLEHQVEVVQSGHRLTLTYNLSFAPESAPRPSYSLATPNERLFEEAFQRLLSIPSFLPNGGRIGFGLRHQYPLSYDQDICLREGSYDYDDYQTEHSVLPKLENYLKGWDAIIMRVCKKLDLDAGLRIIYKTEDASLIMCDKVFYQFNMDGELYSDKNRGGKVIDLGPLNWFFRKLDEEVTWVTPLSLFNTVHNTHMAYGNQPTIEHTYGNVCLVARVKGSRHRGSRLPK